MFSKWLNKVKNLLWRVDNVADPYTLPRTTEYDIIWVTYQVLLNVERAARLGDFEDCEGICSIFSREFHKYAQQNMLSSSFFAEADELFGDVMVMWPYHSGHKVFPVEGKRHAYMTAAFNNELWNDERRWDLLRFMIRTLEKNLDEDYHQ